MRRTFSPTTLAFCCQFPAGMPASQLAACLDAASEVNAAVTWAAPAELLHLLAERRSSVAGPSQVAIDVPAELTRSRQSLRRLFLAAEAAAPGIDTASLHGPLPQDCRKMLVDAGIRVVLRDQFESVSRGVRRPAPIGWPCRSVLWGLWEVTSVPSVPPGMMGRLLSWSAGHPRPGGLVVVNLAGGATPTAFSVRDRLDRWLAWARRQRPGTVETVALGGLPALITGAGRRPLSGSVLKAA